jgi:hypothetical protein
MPEPAGKPIVLVALGGHAFIHPGQREAIEGRAGTHVVGRI